MKKLKLTKVIASTLLVALLLTLNPMCASAEWKKDNVGWSYKEGDSYAIGWKLIDGKWYYFGSQYYMVHGVYLDGYYLDSNGVWTKNANYTRNDIEKLGIITGTSGKDYGRAAALRGDGCTIVNGEPCLSVYNRADNTQCYLIGLNTLNIYNTNKTHDLIDAIKLPVNTGNVSTTYNQNDNAQIVTFADKNLEDVVRNTINKPSGTLYKSDVLKITELKASIVHKSSNDISNLSGIENLINLKSLVLIDNQIKDISALKGLINLTYINLNYNQISDISALNGLTNLKSIGLRDNKISDISALKGVTNLHDIDLGTNQISDISTIKELKGLNNLQYIDLGYNQISDISELKELTNLKSLTLWYNQISDISALKGLTNLTSLYLDNNQISDYAPTKTYYNKLSFKDFDLDTDLSNSNSSTTKSTGKKKIAGIKETIEEYNAR